MARKTRRAKAVPTIAATKPRVAGVDIGSRQHWICGPDHGDDVPNVRAFGTTTPELEKAVKWLANQHVESVAMESTSVYWIPLFEMLESRGIDVVLVDARQVHNVPGRKTDMLDCQWIQALHSCGLLRASFRPAENVCKVRALQRQQTNLIAERTKAVQWMQKALDQMNVQVHRAVTDITGKTGMSIVRSIVDGERDPHRLADLRDPRCRKTRAEIAACLTGTWRDEHLFNLAAALRLYDALQEEIRRYEERISQEVAALQPPERRDQPLPPHQNPVKERSIHRRGDQRLREVLWRASGVDLTRIDGVSAATAQTVLTEVGFNLSSFPTEKHFVSWLRLSPRAAISGGKPLRKRRNGLGATRVANALRMAATSLRRSKTALGAAYRRVARLKSAAVAVQATARKIAQIIFRTLRFGQNYTDIGEAAYQARFEVRRLAGLRSAAAAMGYELTAVETDR